MEFFEFLMHLMTMSIITLRHGSQLICKISGTWWRAMIKLALMRTNPGKDDPLLWRSSLTLPASEIANKQHIRLEPKSMLPRVHVASHTHLIPFVRTEARGNIYLKWQSNLQSKGQDWIKLRLSKDMSILFYQKPFQRWAQ